METEAPAITVQLLHHPEPDLTDDDVLSSHGRQLRFGVSNQVANWPDLPWFPLQGSHNKNPATAGLPAVCGTRQMDRRNGKTAGHFQENEIGAACG